MDRTPQLSRLAQSMRPGVFAVLEERIARVTASGTRIIPLHIGDTCRPPPEPGRFPAAIGRGGDSAALYAYGPTGGDPALKAALADWVSSRRGLDGVEARHVVIGAGATHALFCAARAILDGGDEVIMLAPYWPLASGIFHACGASLVEVGVSQELYADPTHDFAAAVRAAITPRTRAIYFVSPNNPDGLVLTRENLVQIARIADEHDLWVFADEVYADISYGAVPPVSFAAIEGARARSVLVYSLSKSHALAGARVGFVVAPYEVCAAALRFSTHTVFNVPMLCQRAALGAIEGGAQWMTESLAAYREARDAVLAKLAGTSIRFHAPHGATYVFVDLAPVLGGRTLVELIERAIDQGVLLAPGPAFGAEFTTHARLCFTSAPRDIVVEGIDRLLLAIDR